MSPFLSFKNTKTIRGKYRTSEYRTKVKYADTFYRRKMAHITTCKD